VYFDGRSPIGQRVIVDDSGALMEIVGLTRDAIYSSVREVSHPAVFIPLESADNVTVLVRTTDTAGRSAAVAAP
jgi:hypothetical protein